MKTRLAEISALVDSDDAIPAVNGELVLAGLADLAEELAAWANKVTAKDSGRCKWCWRWQSLVSLVGTTRT